MKIEFDNFNIVDFDTDMSEAFFNLIDANRERLEDFFVGTVSRARTLEDTIDYCAVIKQKVKDKSCFPYIVTTKSDEFIGLIDVKNISWNVPKAEWGYFIDSKYEGQGIISKAMGSVVDFLIVIYNFKKLLCRVSSKNQGSIKVALKNYFQLEGNIRNNYRTTKGEIVDLNYYGKIF